jgi:hypothetical protein
MTMAMYRSTRSGAVMVWKRSYGMRTIAVQIDHLSHFTLSLKTQTICAEICVWIPFFRVIGGGTRKGRHKSMAYVYTRVGIILVFCGTADYIRISICTEWASIDV